MELNDSSSFHTPKYSPWTGFTVVHDVFLVVLKCWSSYPSIKVDLQITFSGKLLLTTFYIISYSLLWASPCFVHILIIVYTTSSAIPYCMLKCSFFWLECELFMKRVSIISFSFGLAFYRLNNMLNLWINVNHSGCAISNKLPFMPIDLLLVKIPVDFKGNSTCLVVEVLCWTF